jgi:endonuclease V-like protein UPF0215 family
VLGVDDGRFVPHTKGNVDVVGVVYRGGHWFEGIMHTEILIDGLDATEKLANMIKKSPYCGELRVVFLDGVTFAGFNVVDIKMLSGIIDLPVISLIRKKPDMREIKIALKNLSNYELRWQAIENAGKLFEIEIREERAVYVQMAGIFLKDAEKILRLTSTRSYIPEALRVAHIVASGLTSLKEKI